MYTELASSPVFPDLKYCYVPGRIGFDLDPKGGEGIRNGYDPATGQRAVVLGSAVSQVVPLDDFIKTHNEQIYNPSPAIVPLVTALVYDITQYNTLGATTFTLPAFYTRDRIGAGTDYVSKLGQTALFAGGPGYDDTAATALQLESATTVASPDYSFTTYTFATRRPARSRNWAPGCRRAWRSLPARRGRSPARSLTSASSASTATTRGPPASACPSGISGPRNAQFTATTDTPVTPVTVYDPAHPYHQIAGAVSSARSAREQWRVTLQGHGYVVGQRLYLYW